MLEHITIDSVMKDYFSSICSDKLSEENINIDEDKIIEDSASKYLQLFACFLNESYYRGYVLSSSIMNKLMNIIEYEGFEFQILEKYIDILLENMNDYDKDNKNRPAYREIVLEPEDSKEFILAYLKSLKENCLIYKSNEIPHFKNPESTSNEEIFDLVVLNERMYPIDDMYKYITQNEIRYIDPYVYISIMKVLYDNNISAYTHICNNTNSVLGLVFLLDEESTKATDILVDNIKSLDVLSDLIEVYEQLYRKENKNENRKEYRFNDIVNNNIRRLIELLTINVSIEQTAMLIANKYNLWRKYCDENYHKLDTLLMALNLHQSDPDKFRLITPLEYIYKLAYYKDDYYFYIRQALLNIDYNIFFNNFDKIYIEVYIQLEDKDLLFGLFNEIISRYISLKDKNVDDKLVELYNHIEESLYFYNCNKSIIRLENDELLRDLFIKEEGYDNLLKLFKENVDIKTRLLNRNGKFSPILLGDKKVKEDYKYYRVNKKYLTQQFNYDITIGSIFDKVKDVQSTDPSIVLLKEFYDNSYKKCFEDNANYVAMYVKSEDLYNYITIVYGDDNIVNTIRINSKPNEKILVGIFDISNSKFIVGGCICDNISNLSDYADQLTKRLSYQERYIIEQTRKDSSVYFDYDLHEGQNYTIELSNGKFKDVKLD